MRRVIRWVDPEGYVSVGVEHPRDGEFSLLRGLEDPLRLLQGESFPLGPRIVPADEFSLELEPGLTLIAPIDPPEVWCTDGTYDTGDADPMESSPFREVYSSAAENHRPQLLMKDAGGRRTVGPGHAIGIRGDSTWTVPEPEIAVVIGGKGTILGYTIANDITSREIEGANPLFLTQAKVHAGSCAIGPSIFVPEYEPSGFQIVMRITDEEGEVLYQDTATTAQMTRSFQDLVAWLVRDNPVPAGTVLLTGTGLVLPDELNLLPGQWVEIHVPEIGTLVNHVVLASDLA